MRIIFLAAIAVFLSCCTTKPEQLPTAQEIVDKSIEASGGQLHRTKDVSFQFRGIGYASSPENGKKVLQRIIAVDSFKIVDVKRGDAFQRTINDSLVSLPDSLSSRYANSVNSVHYFARLPFGLNDAAANKKFMDTVTIASTPYYQIEVTFDEENGGKDFDDVFYYWFNRETFKVDYLAYRYHTDGGGIRFREAYNERYVNGIRFVDYNNYKPLGDFSTFDFTTIAQEFEKNKLELLSQIALENITVE